MPSSLTRPTATTSMVSPSMTARTSTGSERRNAAAAARVWRNGMEAIASARLAMTSRNFIAISSDMTLPWIATEGCKRSAGARSKQPIQDDARGDGQVQRVDIRTDWNPDPIVGSGFSLAAHAATFGSD